MDPKAQEFVRLIAAAGWSQAEAARRLNITPGAVSQICSGRTRPRAATLNLLKLILVHEKRQGLALRESAGPAPRQWERQLLEDLRRLPEPQRERLLAVIKDMIRAMQATARRA